MKAGSIVRLRIPPTTRIKVLDVLRTFADQGEAVAAELWEELYDERSIAIEVELDRDECEMMMQVALLGIRTLKRNRFDDPGVYTYHNGPGVLSSLRKIRQQCHQALTPDLDDED